VRQSGPARTLYQAALVSQRRRPAALSPMMTDSDLSADIEGPWVQDE
jgi:hypothetical protein